MKGVRQKSDLMVLASAFFFTVLYFLSYIFANIYVDETFEFAENKYRDDIYPLLNSIGYCGISLVLLWNAIRIGSCQYTKIAVYLYLLLTFVTLLYRIFLFEYILIINIVFYITVIGVSALFFIYIIRKWIGHQ